MARVRGGVIGGLNTDPRAADTARGNAAGAWLPAELAAARSLDEEEAEEQEASL